MKKEGEKESERRRRIEKEMPLKGMRRGKTTSSFFKWVCVWASGRVEVGVNIRGVLAYLH